MRRQLVLALGLMTSFLVIVGLAFAVHGQPDAETLIIMPLVFTAPPTPTPEPTPTPLPTPDKEFRGLWVTRFNWTNWNSGDPAKIDEMVNNAALAGFNAILFQVRGEGDAYYTPGPEPWARRLSGTLGQNPGWDPLQRMIEKAHAKGIQVHAYVNVYSVWADCNNSPPSTSPQHIYHKLASQHGYTGNKNNGLQWVQGSYSVLCSDYIWATPASAYADSLYLEVADYLADNYNLDGLHLDRIRYGGQSASCDPVSAGASGVSCFQTPSGYSSYAAWQRAQVNGTVSKFYNQMINDHPNMMLSAAVWHTYKDLWGFGFSQGYYQYYQDSKAWMSGGYIDAIMPMIYSSNDGTSNPTFSRDRWRTLVQDFQNDSSGRYVIAGIGSNHYASFSEIEARIEIARDIGTAGHALFSYGGLAEKGYFDDLAAGPYATPAAVPDIPWH